MLVTFRGREFEVVRRNIGPDLCGTCQDECETVEISTRLKGRMRLDTEIHEALHACLPMLDETIIEPVATDITAFLWRIGYRIDLLVEK